MKYLGIDYGEKRIGLALGDDAIKVASPFRVLENRGMDLAIEEISKIVIDESIGRLVVGMPFSLNERRDQPGEQEKIVKYFISLLEKDVEVPVAYEDERFTSSQVDKLMAGEKLPNGQRDAVSAMLILQSYFDRN